MRATLPVLFLAAILACFVQLSKATPTNYVARINTKFIADAKLDADDLTNVVKLAKLCGIGQVVEVRTFHYLPGVSRGIEVTGADYVSGRDVTYQTVEIFREGWFHNARPAKTLPGTSVGLFWVEGLGLATTHAVRLFDTVNGLSRVEVGFGISTNVTDTIINAFMHTNFIIRESPGFESVVKPSIEQENLRRPEMLTRAENKDHYMINFSGGGRIYECVLSSKKVYVVSFELPPTP